MANTSKGCGFLKRTPSTDAKKQPSKYAKYEQNRSQRKVQEGWKTGRPWLSIEKINNLMSCTWCEQQWTTAKLETLKSHETSNIHIKNRDIIAGKSKAADGMETEAMKCVESLNKAVMDKLSLLFRNAHALSLAGRPFSDFEWMSKLDQMKGLDVGKTYLNRKRAKEFTDCIAKVQMNTIKDNIHKAKFVSILSDGSTDASITEIEMIYTRVCVNGIVQVFFVNTAYVAKSDASGIIEAMKRSVEKLDVPWDDFTKKLVGMGSDGASVMLGCNNGVAAHLRRIQPVMVAVHCYAHKLELAFKDAIKHVPLDSKVTTCLLQGLYYLYHNSALNRSNLKDSFKSLGMKVVLPTRIGGTRWVGHLLRALINFMSGYQAIKKHLEQVCASATHKVSNSTSGKAKGLLKLITSRDIILYCHFMADIATILSRVSKVFQVRECCAADIHGIISETSMLINVYATKDGPYLSKAKQILNLNEETSSMRQRPGESFPAARRNLVAGLSVSLKNRFELDDIIQAMAIANFHTWPLPNSEADNTKEIEDFGDDHLPVILSHFETSLKNGAVDEIEAVLEWTALKSTLYARMLKAKKKLNILKYDLKSLENAVDSVKSGQMSVRKAAVHYNVPKSTVGDRVTGKRNIEVGRGRKPALPLELENSIVKSVKRASQLGVGISRRQLLARTGTLVKKLKIKTPFKNSIPGKDWWQNLKERHTDLVIRKPEKTGSLSQM
ncbi:Hypothetical predicted protein [Mytilus galloprovincialis]|uniref:HTH psq-type domain-containing protein n=1 Tax=Mytilus galloprovincialis TaxID=29158 RepID=A0A8B6FWH3_MYTGA|nr:Hypothetical predicted protein [Mytilus galloprovincialis]